VSENKMKRWQKIAQSAMLQCGGCLLPEVAQPLSLKQIADKKIENTSIALYEADTQSSLSDFKHLKSRSGCNILTGPEGGFSAEEIEALQSRGWQVVWLGPRIFRAETAPLIAIASIIDCCWGGE
ncbi:MAG: RsmE family RNA methyltransferase, partial [Candidatus Rifleibacteriota bacterium]